MSYKKADEKTKRRTGKKKAVRKRIWEIRMQGAAFLTVLVMWMILAEGKEMSDGSDAKRTLGNAEEEVISCQLPEQNRKERSEEAAKEIPGDQQQGQERLEAQAGGMGDEGGEVSGKDEWYLILVNSWNPLPAKYEVELELLEDDHAVDKRCYPMLQDMLDDCRAQGLEPLICSSWRSFERQKELYEKKEERLVEEGCPKEQAAEEAAKTVAAPGNSEHQTGLALDLVDSNYPELETAQEDTPVQRWLMANSWKYGFVLRYPAEKSEVTGIIYEPWHYRYVGREAAEEMYRNHLCLEEYLANQYQDTQRRTDENIKAI